MYKKILVFAFCFGSICAGESDVRESKPIEHKYKVEIAELSKKIESADIMMELKLIKSMLGLILFGGSLYYLKKAFMYAPNNWMGCLTFGFINAVNFLSLQTMLDAFVKSYKLSDLKNALEKDKARLLSMPNEENACASSALIS